MGILLSDQRLRAMYPGGRGDRTARRFARLWAGVFAQGLAPRRWVTLEVRGRRSGRALRFPLGMADWRGHWYLVSMIGEQCNWVCNVRAADGKAALRRRGAIPCQLVEVPPGERAPIIKRYLEKVPGGRPHIPVDRDAPVAAFEAVSSRTPVFLVVPVPPPYGVVPTRKRHWGRCWSGRPRRRRSGRFCVPIILATDAQSCPGGYGRCCGIISAGPSVPYPLVRSRSDRATVDPARRCRCRPWVVGWRHLPP